MFLVLCIQEVEGVSSLVSNGTVDFQGQIADKAKTGEWKSSPYIIGIRTEIIIFISFALED